MGWKNSEVYRLVVMQCYSCVSQHVATSVSCEFFITSGIKKVYFDLGWYTKAFPPSFAYNIKRI